MLSFVRSFNYNVLVFLLRSFPLSPSRLSFHFFPFLLYVDTDLYVEILLLHLRLLTLGACDMGYTSSALGSSLNLSGFGNFLIFPEIS